MEDGKYLHNSLHIALRALFYDTSTTGAKNIFLYLRDLILPKKVEQYWELGLGQSRSLKSPTHPGPLLRPNGSLDRHGKVEKSGPDRSFIRKK